MVLTGGTLWFTIAVCFVCTSSPPLKIFYDKVNTVNIFEEPCYMAVMPCNIPAIRDHRISVHRSIKAIHSRSHVCVSFFANSGSPLFYSLSECH